VVVAVVVAVFDMCMDCATCSMLLQQTSDAVHP